MCAVSSEPHTGGALLEISGPFALFRHTLLYGRALGSLLPILAWTRRFRLDADCDLGGRRVKATFATGDPIFPAAEPRRFDSRIEERFARDFGRAAQGWSIVREPEPIEAGRHLVFPDFAVFRRGDPGHRWFVEIAGFWTPEYLDQKLRRLREAGIANLVLCVDKERNVGQGAPPFGARRALPAPGGSQRRPPSDRRARSNVKVDETSRPNERARPRLAAKGWQVSAGGLGIATVERPRLGRWRVRPDPHTR